MKFRDTPRTITLCVATLILAVVISAQGQNVVEPADTKASNPDLRVETLTLPGGAELVTIFARQSNLNDDREGSGEIPLVSLVRDTLGDDQPENDKLRFVWMLTYTTPSFWQKAAAFVPFLYTRTSNKGAVGKSPPPPVADMQVSDKAFWNKLLWFAFRKTILGQAGVGPRASALQYRQNADDYRRSAIAGALAVLAQYEKTEGEKVLSDTELKDIQARLWLQDKTFGGMMQDENLTRVYEKKVASIEDNRGHNWELLRQYAEAQGLYFEPILMPDGSATHAMVWTSTDDIAANRGRKFEGRFLNISSPWDDERLNRWNEYTQERWFDDEGRITDRETPNARKRTMIPLAVYGLDTVKIPGILIDFRDDRNAKRREMSRRILNDVTGNVLAISPLSNIPYILGRTFYNFAMGRRGIDINQASRVRSYSQLKMLLALDDSLNTGLRHELANRIEDVSLNPLENDIEAEARIARGQYRNLVDYARRPDGLAARLDRDRREEMVKYAHSGKKRALFKIGHVLSFGTYTHREDSTPELTSKMDTGRRLNFHERVINEIAGRSVRPEVDSDIDQLRRSLLFLSENGVAASGKTAKSLSRVFSMLADEDLRRLCIVALYKVDNSTAKSELLAICRDQKVDTIWRDLSARFLKQSVAEGKRISTRTAVGVAALSLD